MFISYTVIPLEWNKEYFVLEIFKESLQVLNLVANFLSSSFIVSKRFSILESEINKFISSANIIGVSLLELSWTLVYWKGHLYICEEKLVQCAALHDLVPFVQI